MVEQRNALADRERPPGSDRLSVEVAAECARFSLRARAKNRGAAGEALGLALPARIGEIAAAGDRLAICLGPDEWVLLAPSDEGPAIAARFAALPPGTSSLVDIGHREVGIEVRGTAATLALASLCALDLDAMPAGSATRTLLDKSQAVLVKHAPDHYRIEVWQSFASHVWTLLGLAGREIALDI